MADQPKTEKKTAEARAAGGRTKRCAGLPAASLRGFTKVENAVLFHTDLRIADVGLYAVLKHWRFRSPRRPPSREILRDWTGLGPQPLTASIQNLVRAGLLAVRPGGGHGRRTTYELLAPPALTGPKRDGTMGPKRAHVLQDRETGSAAEAAAPLSRTDPGDPGEVLRGLRHLNDRERGMAPGLCEAVRDDDATRRQLRTYRALLAKVRAAAAEDRALARRSAEVRPGARPMTQEEADRA